VIPCVGESVNGESEQKTDLKKKGGNGSCEERKEQKQCSAVTQPLNNLF